MFEKTTKKYLRKVKKRWCVLALGIFISCMSLAQVRIPGPGGKSIVVAVTDLGPMDTWIHMNTSTPGTTLTVPIMNAASTGDISGGYVFSAAAAGLTVAAAQANCTLLAPLSVNGTAIATGATVQSIALANSQANSQVKLTAPADFKQLTIAGCIVVGAASVSQGAAVIFDYMSSADFNGGGGVAQLNNGNCGGAAVFGLNFEINPGTIHSACITLVPGNAYWVSEFQDYELGNWELCVYNMPSGSLVGGSCLSGSNLSTANPSAGTALFLGNGEVGTSTGNTFFQDWMIRYSGGSPHPVTPTGTTQPPVFYKSKAHGFASGASTTTATTTTTNVTAGNVVACGWTSENAASTVSGLADTAGNTWVSDATCKVTLATQGRGEMWWTIAGSSNAADTITATHTSSTFRNLTCVQMSAAVWDSCATGTKAAAVGADVTTSAWTPSTATGSNYCAGYITAGTDLKAGTNYELVGNSSAESWGAMFRTSAPNSSQTATLVTSNTSSKWLVCVNFHP